MIRSMTGFGRATFEIDGRQFEIEARSVNHRHLDLRVRLPHALQDLDRVVRAFCQERLVRGKVDLNVQSTESGSFSSNLEVDVELASRYVEAARELGEAHGIPSTLDMSSLLAMPGVTRQVDPVLSTESAEENLCQGVQFALDALHGMQLAEGRKLEEEFGRALGRLEKLIDWLEGRATEVFDTARERLEKRVERIREETGLLDAARLHQEVVIAADRLDITEELVRLRSHVDQFRAVIGEGESRDAVGRRLDFLLQEMGREANTVGAKANDAPLAHQVVELKTQLEKLREQVQNVA